MSENIFSKAANRLLGTSFGKEAQDPHAETIGEAVSFPPAGVPTIIRPQAIGSAELIFGDVPHVPPEFKP